MRLDKSIEKSFFFVTAEETFKFSLSKLFPMTQSNKVDETSKQLFVII